MQGFNRPSQDIAFELMIALFIQKIRLLNNCQFSRNSKEIVLTALIEKIKQIAFSCINIKNIMERSQDTKNLIFTDTLTHFCLIYIKLLQR